MDMNWKWEVERQLQELRDRANAVDRFRELMEDKHHRLEDDLAGTDRAVATHNDRISKLERGEFDVPTITFNSQIPRDVPDEFSPPIGQDTEVIERVPKTVDGEDDFRPYPATDLADTVVLNAQRELRVREALDPLNPVTPQEAYERGLNEALKQAEVRVVDYMSQHFTQATINGVVGALKGTKGWFNG